ncbi:MAG TPA: hypothetical protein PLU10_03855 [Chitinophagaceae bacterium]|nr:hypothetical protein [Chitinophagaceae bacterium]
MKSILFCCMFICFFATSCRKNTLPKASIRTGLIAYVSTDIDSVIVKRYVYGSHFTQFVDSTLLTNLNRTDISSQDTTVIYPSDQQWNISDAYDWEIINPYDQHSAKIENVQYNMIEYTSGIFAMDPPRGNSPVSSYILNGNQVSIASSSQYDNVMVYMTK